MGDEPDYAVAEDDLGHAGLRLWNQVLGEFELGPVELEILRQACHAADMLWLLDTALNDSLAIVVTGASGQVKLNPMFAEAAQQRRVQAALLRQLMDTMDDAPEQGRPDLKVVRLNERGPVSREAPGAGRR